MDDMDCLVQTKELRPSAVRAHKLTKCPENMPNGFSYPPCVASWNKSIGSKTAAIRAVEIP